jgi:hypothetical protein
MDDVFAGFDNPAEKYFLQKGTEKEPLIHQTIAAPRKENSELKETLAAYDYHYGGLHPAAVEGIKKQMARKATEG